MFSQIVSVAITLVLASVAAADELSLATPQLTQCKEATLQWSGGEAKYALFMLPYNDPCGDAAKEWNFTSKNEMHYTAAVPAGAKVQFLVEDANGDEAWSGIVTVQSSDDDSCIDQDSVKVLQAAGALATNNDAGSASGSSTASGQPSGSLFAPPIPGTGAPGASSPYPTSGAGSSGSDGVANAANDPNLTPQNSGSLPQAQVAGSIAGLAILLLSLFQL